MMIVYEHIQTDINQGTATIWLNRPEKHNALNQVMIDELQQAFIRIAADSVSRLIVLRGSGKSFCAGADLSYMRDISTFGPEENYNDALKLARLFETIYTCPKPVIAVLHGAVYGGANGLSAAADIVLADEQTTFSFSEVKLGITPATISPYVIARCGQAAASELMLTGRKFSAPEAYRFLLVNALFTIETLDNQLEFYTGHLQHAGPNALSACKKLIREVSGMYVLNEKLKEYTARSIAEQRATDEAKEGIRSFFEKRPPNWI